MQAARAFLPVVGLAYLGLGFWCAAAPGQTSNSIGFNLQKGSGQSVFFVVYGGLEVAWGLIFLAPLIWSDTTKPFLGACLVIHGVAVIFRAISLFLFSEIGTTTYALAAVEWVIFVGSAGLFAWVSSQGKSA